MKVEQRYISDGRWGMGIPDGYCGVRYTSDEDLANNHFVTKVYFYFFLKY